MFAYNHPIAQLTTQWALARRLRMLWLASGVVAAPAIAQVAIPPETALPVVFTKTVSAAKVKAGDLVVAKTIEAIILPSGATVPKGSEVVGHVTEARPFVFDPTPYAQQQPSYMAVHFDRVRVNGQDIPVRLQARALATMFATDDARRPPPSDLDSDGTLTQVGGDQVIPSETEVRTPDGDIVGYKRKQGVVAHLIPAEYVVRDRVQRCRGTDTEQSVAIFSASACGLYGYVKTIMTDNGATDGTFRLESPRFTITLRAESTALLQVLPEP